LPVFDRFLRFDYQLIIIKYLVFDHRLCDVFLNDIRYQVLGSRLDFEHIALSTSKLKPDT